MTTKVLNKLVNICTNLDGGSSSSSGTSVSKTVTEATVVPFMKLTADQINTFEGSFSGEFLYDGSTSGFKVYVKILACGDYVIEPMFCTVEPLHQILVSM